MNAPHIAYSHHPPGLPHQRDTVRKMADLARAGAHTYFVRHLATEITRDVPSKQPAAELAALYAWVDRNIRYRNDPVGLEWVQSPERTVREGAGDCDDIGTLLMALAQTLGRETRVQIVGATPGRYQHVYIQAQLPDGRWFTLDPVLEPPRDTVGALPELGPGWKARGHVRTFDSGGRMLGAPTTARERLLWQTVPYFPQVPPTSGYADPKWAGRAMPADYRYRSRVVGGKTIWEPTHSGVMRQHGELGDIWDVISDVAQVAAPIAMFVPGIGPALATGISAAGSIAEVIGNVTESRPGVPQVQVSAPGGVPVSVTPATGAAPGAAVSIGAPGAPGRVVVTTTVPTAVGNLGQRTPGGLLSRGASLDLQLKPEVSTAHRFQFQVSAADPLWKARAASLAAPSWKQPHPGLRAQYPPDARQLWDPSVRQFRIFIPLTQHGACPLGQVDLGQCPPGWTAVRPGTPGALPPSEAWAKHRSGLGQGLMIVPAAASLVPIVAAFGGIRPSVSFSLGDAGMIPKHRHRVMLPSGEVIYTESAELAGWLAPDSPVLGQAPEDFTAFRVKGLALARAAVNAVTAHINSRADGRPPGGPVPAVGAFQTHDASWPLRERNGKPLLFDELYGPNTRTAAAWYMGGPASEVTPPYNAGLEVPVTWTPPTVAAIVPTATTAATTATAPTTYSILSPQVLRRFETTAPTTAPTTATRTGLISTAIAPRTISTTAPTTGGIRTATAPVRVTTSTPVPTAAPAPIAQAPAPRYIPFTSTTPAAPEPEHIHRLPVTGPYVPPIPIPPHSIGAGVAAGTCPTGTQAAPGGGCPPAAVYRDASGTPRATGYVEVAQEDNNPGMPPIGLDIPQSRPPYATHPGLPPPPAGTAGTGAPSQLWMWLLLGWAITRKGGK